MRDDVQYYMHVEAAKVDELFNTRWLHQENVESTFQHFFGGFWSPRQYAQDRSLYGKVTKS